MIRHLARLIWNRKRANFLILLEIFFSFLVLFTVVLLAVQLANNYRQPLGYAIDDVWSVALSTRDADASDLPGRQRVRATIEQFLQALKDMPEVESACGVTVMPYSSNHWRTGVKVKGQDFSYYYNITTDDCPAVFRIAMTRGRWFAAQDVADVATPVVLNEQFARELFGDEDPTGRMVPLDPPTEPRRDGQPHETFRVTGVIREFRQDGELAAPDRYMLQQVNLRNPASPAPQAIAVRVRPGTPAAFEETLVKRFQAIAPDWSFEARPLASMRDDSMRDVGTPLIAFAIIAAFLLMMVALGLTGVVWQNVTQRTREFGLRRAKGATMVNVRRQVLAELSLMTTLALLLGVALVLQLTLLPRPRDMDVFRSSVFFTALAVSTLTMYLLTLACAWYPSRLSTRIQPADALHYE